MALTLKKYPLPDGVPGGGDQNVRSSIWGENDDTSLDNGTYRIKPDAGNIGDVLTVTAAGIVKLAPVQTAQETDINSDTTLVNTNFVFNVYEVDCTAGPVAIELPLVSTVQFQHYLFVKVDSSSNKLTLTANGTQKLNGASSQRIVSQFDTIAFIPDSAAWFIENQNATAKTLVVNRAGSGVQSIPSGSPQVVEFNNIIVDSGGFFDAVTNFDYTPGNAIFQMQASIELEDLDNANFLEICIRKDGTPIVCSRVYSTSNNQAVVSAVFDLNSNIDPTPGVYDITIEHDQGSNLDLLDSALKTYWKLVRIA